MWKVIQALQERQILSNWEQMGIQENAEEAALD